MSYVLLIRVKMVFLTPQVRGQRSDSAGNEFRGEEVLIRSGGGLRKVKVLPLTCRDELEWGTTADG